MAGSSQTITFPDYSDDIAKIIRNQESLSRLVTLLLHKSTLPSVVKISDIANMYGYSYDFLRTTGRYLLPRFGESAFSEGAARWTAEEWLAWDSKPIEEKQAAYHEWQRQQLRKESLKRRKAAI